MWKSLLLVVDVQRGFINEYTKPVVPKINELTKKWQDRKWPIVASRFINLQSSNWQRLRDWHELESEPDTLLAKGLKIETPYIFKKSTYSAWSNEVLQVCHTHEVHDVVIAGVDTNECVLATALAVFDAGFRPWVVEDGCASTGGQKPHDMSLTLLKALLGETQVIKSQELL